MEKQDIFRRLLVLQADALDVSRQVAEMIAELQDDQEEEPQPLSKPT